ncbi:MAG: lysophospholipid acyltransferase family protein [Chthoniobacterales bacterium]
MTAWKRMRYRLEWLGLVAALQLVPLLPRVACDRLARIAGSLAARLDRRGRGVAQANLESAFGARFSPEQRKAMVRASYQHFAGTMLALFWSPRLTPDNFRRYIELEGFEQLYADIGPGGSCIFGAFHYGNFEWLSLAVGWIGFTSSIATEEFKNPLLRGFFEKLRDQSGHRAVPRAGAIIRLYKTLRKGGRVALLADTTLPAHHPTVVIECFGRKTMITVSHAWLQERTGAPLIPFHMEALGGGRYRIVAHPKVEVRPGATHQEIAQACWDSFEPVVRENPAPWMWMYKHWRYKPAGASGYPFYAQESWAFDDIASHANYAKLDRSLGPAARNAA